MESVIVGLWALLAAYVAWVAWFTHDIGPASESGPIAGLAWVAAVLGAIVVAVIHSGYRLAQGLLT